MKKRAPSPPPTPASRTFRRPLVGAVAAVLLLLVVGIWFESSRSSAPVAGVSAGTPTGYPELVFDPPPTLTQAAATRLFNEDTYLIDFIRRYGPEAATTAVRDWAEAVGVTHCHDRAHEIGRMAYDVFGVQAFAFAGHSCKSGAMHGVTESHLSARGTDNLAADVEAICADAVRQFFRHQCVHGIGHGLLAWVDYELPEALGICEPLTSGADRESCYSGVFMENISGSLAGGMVESEMQHAGAHGHANGPGAPPRAERKGRYLRADDPHYPCNDVADRYVPACYSVQTYHMLTFYENDFAAVARECSSLTRQDLRDTCFSSLGRDVGNNFLGNPEGAIAICGLIDSRYRLNCLEEVVQDWFWEEASAGLALDFCGRMLGSDNESVRCYWQIAWRASDLFAAPPQYRNFCSRFGADYVWLCDFVLFQRLDQFGSQGRMDWVNATPADLREIYNLCRRSFEDAYCEMTLFQQLEAAHRARITAGS
jgi:hypothetical protein